MKIDAIEYVLSRDPFVVRRTVRWSDCDPAGVVYTGHFPEYVLGAVNLFFCHMAGAGGMHAISSELGIDMPCKAMTYEFISALWPNDVFDIHCTVTAIRTHSYDIACTAKKEDGTLVFKATVSLICIDKSVRRRSPIPPKLHEILAQYVNMEGTK